MNNYIPAIRQHISELDIVKSVQYISVCEGFDYDFSARIILVHKNGAAVTIVTHGKNVRYIEGRVEMSTLKAVEQAIFNAMQEIAEDEASIAKLRCMQRGSPEESLIEAEILRLNAKYKEVNAR